MAAEKRSVSAPDDLFAQADARAKELGYSNFSQYIQYLIRKDTLEKGSHIRESSPAYGGQAPPAKPVTYRKGKASSSGSVSHADIDRKLAGIVQKHYGSPPKGSK